MENFWDYKVWGTINLVAVLLLSLLAANMLKRKIPFLEKLSKPHKLTTMSAYRDTLIFDKVQYYLP